MSHIVHFTQIFVMKWDCKYKLFNKVLFSCEAIPSWKGSYGYLSNICNWIKGYIDLQGSNYEHPKEKHNWIYSFLCEHSYTHCGKCWWFFSAPSMFLKCCTSLSIIYNQFDSIFFSLSQLDLATSGQGGIGPYIGICVIVVAFGVATALVQGGVTGDLSFMSPEFVRVHLSLDFFMLLQLISFLVFEFSYPYEFFCHQTYSPL